VKQFCARKGLTMVSKPAGVGAGRGARAKVCGDGFAPRADSDALWAEPTITTEKRRGRMRSDRTHLPGTVAPFRTAARI
jgi:hypothetical protein